MRLILLTTLFGLALSGCGMFGGAGVAVPVEEKDFVTDSRKAMEMLKSDYVLSKGVMAIARQKVDEFLYIEDGMKLGRVNWSTFQDELKSCWSTPMEVVGSAEQRAVNALDAAKHLKNQETLHQLQVVQDSAWNAVQKVKACPQSLTDNVKGMPKRATDEARAWAQGKFQILNELRVLVKQEAPNRAKELGVNAGGAAKTIATQLAEAKSWQAALEKMGNQAMGKKNAGQVKELERLQSEAVGLQTQVTTDAAKLGADAVEMGGRVTTSLDSFKGK